MSDSKARFFLPPDDYEILRFGGESVKDEEKGIKRIMKYYHDSGLTEEQLRENNKKYNLEQMLQIVKEYFGREYGYRGEGIVLSNRYQRSVNSYIFLEDEIHIHCQRKEFVICLLLLMMINMTLTQKMEITCMQVFWMHMMNIAHSCS